MTVEPVAEAVWLVRGGFPKRIMNAYLIDEGDGVTVFDTGIRDMAPGIRAVAAELGGIKRVVLGHAHEDHRGSARALGMPVWCHQAERRYAEAPLKPHTDYYDFSQVPRRLLRLALPYVFRRFDGGPCVVGRTLEEGDAVGDFTVVELPGHSPGQIGLWRDDDRLALTTDCFYTLNPMTITQPFGPPRCTHPAFDYDNEAARLSLLKLAEMEPRAAWPGHANPVTGNVRLQLERAAAKCSPTVPVRGR